MRKPLISGNWKMNHNHFEAIQCVQKLAYLVGKDDLEHADVSIHPPFTDIRSVQTVIDADKLQFLLGAQHCHWEDKGAFTGEVSPLFLAKMNVHAVIVGHSERRELFGETDEAVNLKVAAILRHGMTPIVCVGETLAEREAGETEAKVLGQVRAALHGVKPDKVATLVVAYEPIWAIGTGLTATSDDAQQVCAAIRTCVAEMAGAEAADGVRIQYGGSVKSSNIAELIAQPDIDGALVGGASLDPDEFGRICKLGA
jgi:triosephosphate isomerase (TIM)